jgi:hypothetical protein
LGEFLGYRVEDGVVKCGAEVALLAGIELGEFAAGFFVTFPGFHEVGARLAIIVDQPYVIAEADEEYPVAGAEHVFQEDFEVVLVLFGEVFLAAASVDD